MTEPGARAVTATQPAAAPLTFFFPYHEVSGVPVLFARMAHYLQDRHGAAVTVVDYPEGYMARTLRHSGIRVIPFASGAMCHIPSDTVLVMQAILPYTLRRELDIDPGTRMLFWTLHPLNWVPSIVPSDAGRHLQARHPVATRCALRLLMPRVRRQLEELLDDLARKHSVAFMDGSTWRSTKELLGVTLTRPEFLPVPCPVPVVNRKLSLRSRPQQRMSVGWLGRVADFKVHGLVHAVRRLAEAATTRGWPMTLHIIGGGPAEARLDQLRVSPDLVEIKRPGVLTDDALEQYLLMHVDLLVAMGASALEGARLGIPTILLDPFYGPVPPDYRFRWLHDAHDFSLGDLLPALDDPASRPLEDLLMEAEEDYEALSEWAYSYCASNHAMEPVAVRLLHLAGQAEFCYGDFSPLILKRGLMRRSYEFVRKIRRGR